MSVFIRFFAEHTWTRFNELVKNTHNDKISFYNISWYLLYVDVVDDVLVFFDDAAMSDIVWLKTVPLNFNP